MDASVISFQLDLLVRLIDTTTGAELEEQNVRFYRDEKQVRPVPRGSGNYVFMNCGREDGTLEVTFRYQLSDWTFLYLLSFGEYVEIIKPVEARNILKEKAQKILSMYL